MITKEADLYGLALQDYNKGNLKNALNYLDTITTENPLDMDAVNFQGIIYMHMALFEEAAECLNRVIRTIRSHPTAYYNLGLCYQNLNDPDNAADVYLQNLELNPDHYDTLLNLGVIKLNCKEYAEAERFLLGAASVKPNDPSVLINLGNLNLSINKLYDAAAIYKKVIKTDPRNCDAYYNLGVTHLKLKKYKEAVELFQSALEIKPYHTEALNNLGVLFTNTGEYEKAEECYKKIIENDPSNEDAYFYLGLSYQANHKTGKAVEVFKQIFNAEDKGGDFLYKTFLLEKFGKYSESVNYFDNSGENYNKAVTFTNIGVAKLEQGLIQEALEYFEIALIGNSRLPEPHYNKAHAHLLLGQLTEGWAEYEWRLKRKEFALRQFSKPFLNTDDIKDKRVLVYDEQGLGDSIQFVRYLKKLKDKGAFVILECDRRLAGLYKRLDGYDVLLTREDLSVPSMEHDFQVPLLSLPHYFKTDLDSIPSENSYLTVEDSDIKKWEKIVGLNTVFKAGIVWAGNPNHTGDKKRSCKLRDFIPLFDIQDLKTFILQKGEPLNQVNDIKYPYILLDSFINNFTDTAAAIMLLDIVITVDTSVAHLAGALGKEVWMLLPYVPDWRWMLNTAKTPWYPSMRLFRQKEINNWESVFKEVTDELQNRVKNKKNENLKTRINRQGEKQLTLAITKGENFGWGVCSKYLRKELKDLVKLNDLADAEKVKVVKGKGTYFHTISDIYFNPLSKDRGEYNIGYTFFENVLTTETARNSSLYDLVLGGSSWCVERMEEAGIKNTGLLLQGIDPQLFYPGEERKSDNLFIIFSGGKFEYRKGQDLVLKAVKLLQEKYDNILLVNAWYNLWPEILTTMYHSKHIKMELKGKTWDEFMTNIYYLNGIDSKRVITLPLVPNNKLRELYLKTDIGLFPNRCEGGTNLVMMEYMACGRTVIGSYNSGHIDILTEENSFRLLSSRKAQVYSDKTLISDWQEPELDEIISVIEHAYQNKMEIRKKEAAAAADMKNLTWRKTAENLVNFIPDVI